MSDNIEVTKQTESTQQTSTTEQPVTDPFAAQREEVRQAALREAAAAYNGALQDAERRATQANQRVQELERTKQVEIKNDPTQFLANPQQEVTQIVKRELAEAIAPLNQFAQQFQNQNLYGQIKSQLRIQQGLDKVMPQVEGYLDQQYIHLNPLNAGAVAGLMMTILGQIQAGFLAPLVAQTQTITTGKPLPNPSLVPSPPKVPDKQPDTAVELTENQRRVARIQGMTDAEYVSWMNSSGNINEDRQIGVVAK